MDRSRDSSASFGRAAAPSATQAAIYGCAGSVLTADERAFFADAVPWGFILFARNLETPDQIRRLVDALRAAAGWRAPILIDQEGGAVARLRGPIWREWPPIGDWCDRSDAGALSEADLREALTLRHRLIALELTELGIDVNCAPLVDLRVPGAHAVIGARALGGAPDQVAGRAAAAAAGLWDGGVAPVLKHLPGHGRADVDSHHAPPRITADLATLRGSDFAACRKAAATPQKAPALGMTGHVVLNAVDPEAPATLSSTVVTEVIRRDIGFDGMLMTDDLSMKALSGGLDASASAALRAGCDLALHCNGVMEEMRLTASGVVTLSAEARRRSDMLTDAWPSATEIDAEAATARLAALVAWRDRRGETGGAR